MDYTGMYQTFSKEDMSVFGFIPSGVLIPFEEAPGYGVDFGQDTVREPEKAAEVKEETAKAKSDDVNMIPPDDQSFYTIRSGLSEIVYDVSESGSDASSPCASEGFPEWLCSKKRQDTPKTTEELLQAFVDSGAIDQALAEDYGIHGDVTSLSTIRADSRSVGKFVAKQDGIISGLEIAKHVYARVDPLKVKCEFHVKDGDFVKKGSVIGEVKGNTRSILSGERLALNYMQRCSGIATKTWEMVQKIKSVDSRTVLLDTRKTVPGLRFLDKLAVQHGGGQNHRIQLCDMILIKDNHVDAAGSVEAAIDNAREWCRTHDVEIPIEIETRDLEEVQRVLTHGGINRIMLDNFVTIDNGKVNTDLVFDALKLKAASPIGSKVDFEVSGNINLASVGDVAKTNVDYVSCGALTHSVMAMDISLKFKQ